MPKDEKANQKYIDILMKFGLSPDFSKKERKIIKYLAKEGNQEFLALADHFDWKPEKVRKLIERLQAKAAVNVQGELISLTPYAIACLHNAKVEKKAAKKLYQFMDTLSEKEMDEFMKLIDSFEVVPEAPEEPEEEPKPEPKPAPKPAPKKPASRKPAARKAPARKPAPRKRAPAARKPKPQAPKEENK